MLCQTTSEHLRLRSRTLRLCQDNTGSAWFPQCPAGLLLLSRLLPGTMTFHLAMLAGPSGHRDTLTRPRGVLRQSEFACWFNASPQGYQVPMTLRSNPTWPKQLLTHVHLWESGLPNPGFPLP